MKRYTAIFVILLAIALVAIQFVPVERSNPLGAGDPDAPREVQWILRRACYDCHSNETRWPVWAYMAPMSWQVVSDVRRARAVLNFSEWQAYSQSVRTALRSLVNPMVAIHRMPLWYYVPLHLDARLNDEERAILRIWSEGAGEEMPHEGEHEPRSPAR